MLLAAVFEIRHVLAQRHPIFASEIKISDAMKRRSEAQSAIHHAEAGVNQFQDKKKPEQTLIGAIEQIVNLAIELHLGEVFYEKAREFLTFVAERMSINEEQALIFALFMEKALVAGFKSAISLSW